MPQARRFLGLVFSLGIDYLRLDPAAGAAPLTSVLADLMGITVLCFMGVLIVGNEPDFVPSYCERLDSCPAEFLNVTRRAMQSAHYATLPPSQGMPIHSGFMSGGGPAARRIDI